VTGHSILKIQPAKHQRDDASYECVADNGIREDVADAVLTVLDISTLDFAFYSKHIVLIVNFSAADDEPQGFPRITQVSSASKVVELGQNTALTCETTGQPAPQISWLKNMNQVNYTKNVFKTADGLFNF